MSESDERDAKDTAATTPAEPEPTTAVDNAWDDVTTQVQPGAVLPPPSPDPVVPTSLAQPPLPAFPIESDRRLMAASPSSASQGESTPPAAGRPSPRPEADASNRISGTMRTGAGDPNAPSRSRPNSSLATTRQGVELGRPLFAIAAIGLAMALGGLIVGGSHAGGGVGIGALVATTNFWVFTRIGNAFLEKQGVSAPWALIAGLKLFLLFGIVALVLSSEVASPIAFLLGYLALPIGIVLSQLFGLRQDFDNGEDSV